MQAFSVEESILEGKEKVKDLFTFVQNHALEFEAYEMEKSIFEQLQKIGLTALKCYFAQNGTGDIGNILQIDNKTILKRQSNLHGKVFFSVFGKLSVPRTYYYKEGCTGVTPLDVKVNLPKQSYSYLLQEWMDVLCMRDTFGESEVTLARLLRLKVSSSRFESVSQETTMHYDDFYNQKEKPEAETEGEIQVIGFDGKGVPVIKSEAIKLKSRLGKGEKRQKKKEALVGVSYTIDQKIRTAEEIANNLVYPDRKEETGTKETKNEDKPTIRAKNIRRLASLKKSKQEVMKEIVNDAKNRDPEEKRPWVVVMDGALHLWALISTLLCGINYVGVLDIIHVVEYLWDVANLLYGEKNPKGEKWVYGFLLRILKGSIEEVIVDLKHLLDKSKLSKSKKKQISKVITYFENHLPWMKYDEYLKAGYPIGSGVVESTCGHTVKNRMEGTGRRWSIDGAESILLLRSVYTSSDWDYFWDSHMSFERKRLYGETINILDNIYEFNKSKQADGNQLEKKDKNAA